MINSYPTDLPPLIPKKKRQSHIKPPLRITPEHDPAIPPAAFVEKAILGAWGGSRCLYLGAASDQFAYGKVLQYNCITVDVVDCSKERCLMLRQSHRWVHDIIHGWFEFLSRYMLSDYDTILWVNGPCIQGRERALETIQACEAMKPQRFIIVNELSPPELGKDPPPADIRHSMWTAKDFLELGFEVRMWPGSRGAVLAWKDCR